MLSKKTSWKLSIFLVSESNYATISFIIATTGRPSLQRTLASIDKRPGDEVLVIQHDPPSGNWGNAERQEGTDRATCDYLAFIDDDDVYVPNHREIMAQAILDSPKRYPILFRMQYPSGRVIWRDKAMKCGDGHMRQKPHQP